MAITTYKNIGASLAAVVTIIAAVSTSMWWEAGDVRVPEIQFEAEIMTATINRHAAMDRQQTFNVNIKNCIQSTPTSLYTNNNLGMIQTPSGSKWTAWDTNMPWFGSNYNPSPSEVYNLVTTANKLFTNRITAANAVGASTLVIRHFPDNSTGPGYWRTDAFGTSSTDFTYWWCTNIPPLIMKPYRKSGYPFNTNPYNQTTPQDENVCGTITLNFTNGFVVTNLVNNFPNATYNYPAAIVSALSPSAANTYLGAKYWSLIYSNNILDASQPFDGNWIYDRYATYLTTTNFNNANRRLDTEGTWWTNYVTLNQKTTLTVTNYWVTNTVDSITNIGWQQTLYTNVTTYNANGVFAFERDNKKLIWSTNAYNDLSRALSLMEWQYANINYYKGWRVSYYFEWDGTSLLAEVSNATTNIASASGCGFTGGYWRKDGTNHPIIYITVSIGISRFGLNKGLIITNSTPFTYTNINIYPYERITYPPHPYRTTTMFNALAPYEGKEIKLYDFDTYYDVTNWLYNVTVDWLMSPETIAGMTNTGGNAVNFDVNTTNWNVGSLPYWFDYGNNSSWYTTWRVIYNDALTNYHNHAPPR